MRVRVLRSRVLRIGGVYYVYRRQGFLVPPRVFVTTSVDEVGRLVKRRSRTGVAQATGDV